MKGKNKESEETAPAEEQGNPQPARGAIEDFTADMNWLIYGIIKNKPDFIRSKTEQIIADLKDLEREKIKIDISCYVREVKQ